MVIIARLSYVLAAIELDNDRCFEANEVANVTTDLMLSPELEAVQLASAQMLPEASLGFGSVFTKVTGVVVHAPRTSVLRGATAAQEQPQVAF